MPYPQDICIEMWNAWNKHGVTATEFLSQPRKWHTMIRLFNKRHNGVLESKAAEKQEQDFFKAHGGMEA